MDNLSPSKPAWVGAQQLQSQSCPQVSGDLLHSFLHKLHRGLQPCFPPLHSCLSLKEQAKRAYLFVPRTIVFPSSQTLEGWFLIGHFSCLLQAATWPHVSTSPHQKARQVEFLDVDGSVAPCSLKAQTIFNVHDSSGFLVESKSCLGSPL